MKLSSPFFIDNLVLCIVQEQICSLCLADVIHQPVDCARRAISWRKPSHLAKRGSRLLNEEKSQRIDHRVEPVHFYKSSKLWYTEPCLVSSCLDREC